MEQNSKTVNTKNNTNYLKENYLEEILELNKKYNILPINYNQTFNKLSNFGKILLLN